MTPWTKHPQADAFAVSLDELKTKWRLLHAWDCEPLPETDLGWEAWRLFHGGRYEAAFQLGVNSHDLSAQHAGLKAACMQATHLMPHDDPDRQTLLWNVAERAQKWQEKDQTDANTYFWEAYALGRFSQGVTVAKALAEGLATRVRRALTQTLEKAEGHVGACLALAAFHAEVIHKVGPLIGGMVYGASKTEGLALYRRALTLHPASAVALVEYANGLVMLQGEAHRADALALLEKATQLQPQDATELLDIDHARHELELWQGGQDEPVL